jgi:hypothetical protein
MAANLRILAYRSIDCANRRSAAPAYLCIPIFPALLAAEHAMTSDGSETACHLKGF